jgi:beta-1,4-mannooligosaccharide/beta-1,4-mannosyl-N-acetylglucosamine phosphorylase
MTPAEESRMSKALDVISKYSANPIITFRDVPWPCTGAYNPGGVKTPDGRYALAFRADEFTDINQDQIEKLGVTPAAKKGGSIALALSDDGITFEVHPEPILTPLPDEDDSIYDPRLTMIDGTYWMTYATSTERGILNGIAFSKDLHHWERVHKTLPDNRNALLFPEKVGGLYVRLDRPFGHIFARGRGFDMWIGYSPDMEFWGRHALVLRAQDIPWGKVKVGPSTPPIRTDAGWLTLFHGVEMGEPDRFDWPFTYRTGVMLLDLEDPSTVVGVCPDPIMEPTEDYENIGYRSHVVFPGAMIPEADGTVKIYYGAADQSVALATANLDDLIGLCR